MFEAIFKAKVDELRLMFLATKGVEHNGEKGSFREAFVINLLQQFLPVQFGIGSGVVVDKWGVQSPQVDIVVYDKRMMPPILDKGGHGIYPLDSVLRVIEVKSVVDSSAIAQFTRLIAAFDPANPEGLKLAHKGKLKNGKGYYPVCAMFGYDSKVKNLGEQCVNEKALSQHCLVYVDTGHLWGLDFAKPIKAKLPYGGRYMRFDTRDEGLRMFIGLLFDKIEETARSRSSYSPLEWLMGAR